MLCRPRGTASRRTPSCSRAVVAAHLEGALRVAAHPSQLVGAQRPVCIEGGRELVLVSVEPAQVQPCDAEPYSLRARVLAAKGDVT